MNRRQTPQVDPITVSVIQHRLHAIAEEMGEAMLRTSYSQIINSSRDFSTALTDPEGRLIAQAEHVPIHVGALPWAAKSVHDAFRGRIRPGDVYLLNDPYHGGNHLPDLTAFVPVFDGERLAFWSINRSHQSDIGGATHGAYNPAATEIWQEGIRIPPLKLYDAGTLREDVLETIVLNVRHPREFRGDLAAMIGSARVGERRLLALLAEFGSATTHAAIEAVLDGAERQVRAVIAAWPDGIYHGEAILDDDGHGALDIHIRAKVTKRGSDLEVDLSESDPQVTGFVNSSYPNMRSAAVVALAYLIDPETPKNDGAFRPLTVIAKEGTVVWARPGAPVTLCTNHCGQEILEAIIKALAPACPDRAMAGWGRRFRIALQGKDPRSGKAFIWHLFQARPGGGASPAGDGWPGAGEWQAAGGIKFGSIEVAEVRFPCSSAATSSGPTAAATAAIAAARAANSSLSSRSRSLRSPTRRATASATAPAACSAAGTASRTATFSSPRAGRTARSRQRRWGSSSGRATSSTSDSGGGGGFGDPAERSAEARARDRRLGFVTDGAAD